MFYESNESMSHESCVNRSDQRFFIRSVQNADCRLGTKMQTEFKMQTDKKNCFFASETR